MRPTSDKTVRLIRRLLKQNAEARKRASELTLDSIAEKAGVSAWVVKSIKAGTHASCFERVDPTRCPTCRVLINVLPCQTCGWTPEKGS